MNHFYKGIVASCLIWASHIAPTTVCIEFDYLRDMAGIKNILKKEWPKLFLSSSYDEQLVHKMFFKKRPGDATIINTTVTIDVLYVDNRLAGFITYYTRQHQTGHIELLCIDSGYRKKGYGKLLIDHATHELKLRGCNSIQLYVYTSNPYAIKFYEHLGFSLKANFGSYILLYKPI